MKRHAMKVNLHTGTHVVVDAELSARIEDQVEGRLAKYERVNRVEVHLTDASGGKRIGADVQCRMEARPAGMSPVAVSHAAPTVAAAVDGAVGKLVARLDHALGRLADRGARKTIRHR
jgi:ribosome-associated translation inhibitor RaiA